MHTDTSTRHTTLAWAQLIFFPFPSCTYTITHLHQQRQQASISKRYTFAKDVILFLAHAGENFPIGVPDSQPGTWEQRELLDKMSPHERALASAPLAQAAARAAELADREALRDHLVPQAEHPVTRDDFRTVVLDIARNQRRKEWFNGDAELTAQVPIFDYAMRGNWLLSQDLNARLIERGYMPYVKSVWGANDGYKEFLMDTPYQFVGAGEKDHDEQVCAQLNPLTNTHTHTHAHINTLTRSRSRTQALALAHAIHIINARLQLLQMCLYTHRSILAARGRPPPAARVLGGRWSARRSHRTDAAPTGGVRGLLHHASARSTHARTGASHARRAARGTDRSRASAPDGRDLY